MRHQKLDVAQTTRHDARRAERVKLLARMLHDGDVGAVVDAGGVIAVADRGRAKTRVADRPGRSVRERFVGSEHGRSGRNHPATIAGRGPNGGEFREMAQRRNDASCDQGFGVSSSSACWTNSSVSRTSSSRAWAFSTLSAYARSSPAFSNS